jgi:predicted kinase
MNTLTLLVGLPASGKSTYARERLANDSTIILSSDELRKELLGDENCQENNEFVFKTLYKRAKENLQNGKNVVIDATNINLKARRSALSQFEKMPIRREAIVFATPFELCIERDKERSRTVGEAVIKKFLYRFEIPMKYEGFDVIRFVKSNLVYYYEVLCSQMVEFDQKNPHHLYNLMEHCELCQSLVTERCNIDWKHDSLYLSAKVHDIGKPYTQTFDDNGVAHYYQHHNVGAYVLMCSDKLNDIETLFYVNFHMQPFFWKEQKTHDKYRKLFGERLYNNLMILHECDKIASGTRENTEND